MEQQQTGIFTTNDDKKKFDGWSKENIYEAYLLEVNERVKLEKEIKRLNLLLAEIRYIARA